MIDKRCFLLIIFLLIFVPIKLNAIAISSDLIYERRAILKYMHSELPIKDKIHQIKKFCLKIPPIIDGS